MFYVFFLIDLSTLANVVTTLATMSKNVEEDQAPSNGDTGMGGDNSNNAAKAFDTLAKAVQPQVRQVSIHLFMNLCRLQKGNEFLSLHRKSLCSFLSSCLPQLLSIPAL